MYQRIVASKVRETFAKISEGDWEAMVSSTAPEFTYRFYGDHALGGERRTRDALRRWWRRVFSMLSEPRFTVDQVVSQGPPWNTRVAAAVRVEARLPDGTAYRNVIHQFMTLKWGRLVEVRTLEDTAALERALERLAELGHAEATAAPIED
ncbi:nuclear transport factor 2 family protein [Glycomyces sp. A-F 0318]|uniref:nuclear transport factor 2 family protein n=1 Tax=Glycomyces amatae TaxID=2881355 RepID=UPI001E35A585|nr:nuclear transport factor 2 family protein [Glycomyces amatae]